jgi:hypothetical protein
MAMAADEGAVERHAALPYGDDVAGVGEVVARLIEDDEAEAATEHDAGGDIEEQVVDLGHIEGRPAAGPQLRLGQQSADIEPAEQKPGQIGEPVPLDGHRPELQGDGVDVGKWNGPQVRQQVHRVLSGRLPRPLLWAQYARRTISAVSARCQGPLTVLNRPCGTPIVGTKAR